MAFCPLDCEVLDVRESTEHHDRTMAAWRSVSSGGIAVLLKWFYQDLVNQITFHCLMEILLYINLT